MALRAQGYPARSLTAPQAGIHTNRWHSRARITAIQPDRLQRELEAGQVVIVTGFQGITDEADIPTLGRDPAGGPTWVATIRNISATGVALVLADRLKPGAVLVVQLQGAQHRLSRPLPVRVLHLQAQPDGWLHGCAFLRPVREDDLRELLADGAG